MADCVARPAVSPQGIDTTDRRDSALIRITHWINTASFLMLLVSGVAILLAQPALFWGETGFFGDPSLINLPLGQNEAQTSWGRSLHFLGGWIWIINGGIYILSGLVTRHFQKDFLPERNQIALKTVREILSNQSLFRKSSIEEFYTYNLVQRLAYLTAAFLLAPLTIASGLAMSPGLVAVMPGLVEAFGGYQSAHTVHFFAMGLLVVFFVVHVAMVTLRGFLPRMRGMVSGRIAS